MFITFPGKCQQLNCLDLEPVPPDVSSGVVHPLPNSGAFAPNFEQKRACAGGSAMNGASAVSQEDAEGVFDEELSDDDDEDEDDVDDNELDALEASLSEATVKVGERCKDPNRERRLS